MRVCEWGGEVRGSSSTKQMMRSYYRLKFLCAVRVKFYDLGLLCSNQVLLNIYSFAYICNDLCMSVCSKHYLSNTCAQNGLIFTVLSLFTIAIAIDDDDDDVCVSDLFDKWPMSNGFLLHRNKFSTESLLLAS